MGNIKLEILEKHHVEELRSLYALIFNKKVEPDYFSIKYGLDIENNSIYSHCLLNNNKVIGFLGVIYHHFKSNEEHLKTLGAGDFFILKEYRGKAIYELVYNRVLKVAKEDKLDYIYSFHSDQTYKLGQRWGWKDEDHFVRFHIKGVTPLLAKGLNRVVPKLKVKQLEKLLTPFLYKEKVQFESNSNVLENTYDEQFFKMKEHCKHYWIKLNGVLLCLKYDSYLTIGYIRFDNDYDVNKMISDLKSILKKSLIHDLVIHLQKNTIEAQILNGYMDAFPSFKVSSLKLEDSAPSFSKVKLNFMDMDIF